MADRPLHLVLVGLAGGLASGMFGVGGGLVIVPLLVTALRAPQRRAHATSLAAIVPTGAVGVVAFGVAGRVDYLLAAVLAAGAVIGAPLGVRVLARASERGLRVAFAALLIAIALRMAVT